MEILRQKFSLTVGESYSQILVTGLKQHNHAMQPTHAGQIWDTDVIHLGNNASPAMGAPEVVSRRHRSARRDEMLQVKKEVSEGKVGLIVWRDKVSRNQTIRNEEMKTANQLKKRGRERSI